MLPALWRRGLLSLSRRRRVLPCVSAAARHRSSFSGSGCSASCSEDIGASPSKLSGGRSSPLVCGGGGGASPFPVGMAPAYVLPCKMVLNWPEEGGGGGGPTSPSASLPCSAARSRTTAPSSTCATSAAGGARSVTKHRLVTCAEPVAAGTGGRSADWPRTWRDAYVEALRRTVTRASTGGGLGRSDSGSLLRVSVAGGCARLARAIEMERWPPETGSPAEPQVRVQRRRREGGAPRRDSWRSAATNKPQRSFLPWRRRGKLVSARKTTREPERG